MGGSGLGIAYLSCTVLVSYYFEKYRALSTGIAMSGGGFGMIVISACDQLLVNNQGWQNVSYFYGCLSVVMLLSCLFLKDLKYEVLKPHTSTVENNTAIEPVEPLPMCRDDIFFHSSLRLLEINAKKTSVQQKIKKSTLSPIIRALERLLDLKLLRSPAFLILSLAGFCFVFGFDNPLMLIKGRKKKLLSL
jgi:MFS family permease